MCARVTGEHTLASLSIAIDDLPVSHSPAIYRQAIHRWAINPWSKRWRVLQLSIAKREWIMYSSLASEGERFAYDAQAKKIPANAFARKLH